MACNCTSYYEIDPWYTQQYVIEPHKLYDDIVNGGGYVYAFIADSCIYPSHQINIGKSSFDNACQDYFEKYNATSPLSFIKLQFEIDSSLKSAIQELKKLEEERDVIKLSFEKTMTKQEQEDELFSINQSIDFKNRTINQQLEQQSKLEYEKISFYHGTCLSSLIAGNKNFIPNCQADALVSNCVTSKAGGLTKDTKIVSFSDLLNVEEDFGSKFISEIRKARSDILRLTQMQDGIGNDLFPNFLTKDLFLINLSVSLKSSERWDSFYNKLLLAEDLHNLVLIVVAAGNHGKDLAHIEQYPAKLPNTLPNGVKYKFTVAASGPLKLSDNTNYNAEYVNIAAPGENIVCLTPFDFISYALKGSTSKAAAFVTSLISMLKACDPINMNNSSNVVDAIERYSQMKNTLDATKVKDQKMIDFVEVLKNTCRFRPKADQMNNKNLNKMEDL